MSGLTHTGGVVGATVLGTKIVNGTLPFTGAALGVYVAAGSALVLTGIGLRLFGKADATDNT